MRKNLKLGLFLTLGGILSIVCVTGYGQRSSADQEENVGKSLSIPPPLEGVELPISVTGQKLEFEKLSIATSSGDMHKLMVEVAQTPVQRQIGLMFRTKVPDGTGMLFLFDEPAERAFWMKNTLVPLDIIFVRRDGVITHIHSNAQPHSLQPIRSNGLAFSVLELAGGAAEEHGFNIGDRLVHATFSGGNAE